METSNESGSRSEEKTYVVAGARGLGGAQILFAGFLLTFGVVEIVIQTAMYHAGVPLWTGLVYLVTGTLGVVSSHMHTRCLMISILVTSCLSVVMTICGISVASVALMSEYDNYFPGPPGCFGYNNCWGLLQARCTFDAANLVCAVVELCLSIANISICSYKLYKSGSCISCCVRPGNAYQVQNYGTFNYAPGQPAHAPSYVIGAPVPPRHGDIQQGVAAGTGNQAMPPAHAHQQEKIESQQQQGAATDTHAQPCYSSPPPGYPGQP